MRKLLLILILTLPTILVGQDLRHWFSEEFEGVSVNIPKTKSALVIGNTNYDNDKWDLKNPSNDANLISESFNKLGFDVILKENLDKDQFLDAIKSFKEKQDEYDFSIIYYAGHAIQDENGNSYILPVDFSNTEQIEDAAFNISKLLNYFEKSEKKCLLILDACRNTGNNGLPKPSIQDPINVKLAYSTSFGKTASDEPDLENTIYTSYLSKLFLIEGLSIYDILHNASKKVLSKTDKQQYPVDYFGISIEDIQLTNSK
tara:strand:+ start:103 stop:879 length:777 start_codon:yes stop_codon:yes gene_type:complete